MRLYTLTNKFDNRQKNCSKSSHVEAVHVMLVKKTRIKKLLSNLKNKRIESDGVFSENKKLFFAEISIQNFFLAN